MAYFIKTKIKNHVLITYKVELIGNDCGNEK